MSRWPSSLSLEEVQQSFRELSSSVEPLLTGNQDLHGRKFLNASDNEAVIYEVPLGREMKATQPRFVINAPAGSTFEPYWLECSYRAAGNMSEKKRVRVSA